MRPLGADSYEIVAGERRWRAAQIAKLHDVPVVVRDLADAEALEIAIIENVQRADLNALEEAAAYQELMDRFGRTQEQVAQEVGKSRSHVANTIRLLRAAGGGQGHGPGGQADGRPCPNTVRCCRSGGRGRGKSWPAQMTVRQAEQRSVPKKKPGGKPRQDPNIADLEASISNHLGLKVQIIHKGDKGGEVRIAYSSLEQLDEITRRLSRSLSFRRLAPRPAPLPDRSGRHKAPGPPPRLRCWARCAAIRASMSAMRAHPARRDHRNGKRPGQRGGRRHIHPLEQPVAVNIGEQDAPPPRHPRTACPVRPASVR